MKSRTSPFSSFEGVARCPWGVPCSPGDVSLWNVSFNCAALMKVKRQVGGAVTDQAHSQGLVVLIVNIIQTHAMNVKNQGGG